jgi:hypothetical protein
LSSLLNALCNNGIEPDVRSAGECRAGDAAAARWR